VYAGTDPLTGREIRLRRTCKSERAAQIELGKLLEQADAGRQPETDATVAQLMDRYAEVADWDLSTRKANEVYIRRVIRPALGHLQVRKIRGPLLDLLYTQLKRCSDVGCTGKSFVGHRNVPVLAVAPGSRRPAWQQVAEAIGEAIRSGMLAAGEPLPSVREMNALQDVPVATLQHALAVLADEGLVVVRQGRIAMVAGDATVGRRSGRAARGRDHDCKRAGCQAHVCNPMTAKTIRNIHSILSGAFATAKRWEWIAWNPAESAKPPAVTRRPVPATTPEDVAKVIAEGRKTHPVLALYLWLVAITGARRGELCALQVGDVDLEKGIIHIAFNYVVAGGRRVRKDTKTHQDRYLAIDPVTCAMLREHLEAIRAELAAWASSCPKTPTCSRTTRWAPVRGIPTGPRTRPATWQPRPGSSSTSKGCGTTRPANCSRPDLTCATPRRALAMAATGLPRCGITPIPYPRLTGGPPPTLRS
jgi:DNA-binding transcriptional regulator YhcF (GntR family)